MLLLFFKLFPKRIFVPTLGSPKVNGACPTRRGTNRIDRVYAVARAHSHMRARGRKRPSTSARFFTTGAQHCASARATRARAGHARLTDTEPRTLNTPLSSSRLFNIKERRYRWESVQFVQVVLANSTRVRIRNNIVAIAQALYFPFPLP